VIGLTGGVAAGKSEALAAFARLGAETISSDAVAHEILDDPEVRDLLVERWGADVAPSGAVDREKVGALVFGRPGELAWLESVIHPRVAAKIVDWRTNLPDDARLAVIEVPLLFEAGMDGMFDAVVSVIAPDEVRAQRIAERGIGAAAEESGRQLSQDEKAKRSTHVVVNDGSIEHLEERLREVLRELTANEVAG
jgi:dephospho-CoA kinase